MSAVLERHLLLGGGSAAAQQRKSIKALEKRVGELEEGLGSGLEELRGVIDSGIEGLREERAQEMRQLERRLEKVEDGTGRSGLGGRSWGCGGEDGGEARVEAVPRPGDPGAGAG